MSDDKTGKRKQGLPSEPTRAKRMKFVSNEDIQFGFLSRPIDNIIHGTAAGDNIIITSDGLGDEVLYGVLGDEVLCGARPLRGRAEFEVKIVRRYGGPLYYFGVARCEKSASYPNLRLFDLTCVWAAGRRLHNHLVTPNECSGYGHVDLEDLHEGDRVGVHISQDGVLEFFVNGESQGIAAENIYTRNSDIYAVFHVSWIKVTITKAVTDYNINLQELCLDKLSSLLKSGDEVDRLPLPTRLKVQIKDLIYD